MTNSIKRQLYSVTASWSGAPTKARKIAYWVSTIYVALAMFYGGLAEVLDASTGVVFSSIGIRTVVAILGYPLYFVYIIGIAKMLAAIAILAPGFPRLKEWAYAGIIFNMTGAAATGVFTHSAAWHVAVDLVLAGLTVASWALRQPSRRLEGALV